MAQLVKAVKMILAKNKSGSTRETETVSGKRKTTKMEDIEIGDDAPRQKPSLEEIDALEVPTPFELTKATLDSEIFI
jgi:hypothetical protein